MGDTGFVANFENLGKSQSMTVFSPINGLQPTRASASKPRLCPSTVSMRWFLAYLLFPSITKATCLGIRPCLIAPIRSSRSLLSIHSDGGEDRSHFRMDESCFDAISELSSVLGCDHNSMLYKKNLGLDTLAQRQALLPQSCHVSLL